MMKEILLASVLLLVALPIGSSHSPGSSLESKAVIIPDIETDLFFTENLGQWGMDVDLLADMPFGHIGLSRSGFIYDIKDRDKGKGCVLRYDFVHSGPVHPAGTDETGHITNFFYGNDPSRWVSGARSFRWARYSDVWHGIDADFRLDEGAAKYEFVLPPFSDPDEIEMKLSGHRSVDVIDGDLVIVLHVGGELRETGLKAFYQDDPGSTIDARFRVKGGDLIGFELGKYDRSRTVVIDPLLMHSTFLGSSGSDGGGRAIQGDDGFVYLTGDCGSDGFPTTPGTYDDTWNHYYDIVCCKMDENLTTLLYATYIGGKDLDQPNDIHYAGNGEVIVTGITNSDDLPVTNGSYQSERGDDGWDTDLFLLKLDRTGGELLFSTYIGWAGREAAPCMELDGRGRTVIATTAGDKASVGGIFNGGSGDVLLLGMNSNGSSMEFAHFIGGSRNETPCGMELAGGDLVYLAGSTDSPDFPVTGGSFETAYNTTIGHAGYLSCFNLSSGRLERSTFINGVTLACLDVDNDGTLVMAGTSNVTGLVTSPGAFQKVYQGGRDDIYVLRMDPVLSSVLNSTYLGSRGNDSIFHMDLNETGYVFLTGPGGIGFPVTPGSLCTTLPAGGAIYVDVLAPDLSDLIYGTFLGGPGWEYPRSIFTGQNGTVLVAGETASAGFPVVPSSYDTSFNGGCDIFISRLKCVKVYLPPLEPGNLSGKIVGDSIELSWDDPEWDGDTPIMGYNITRMGEYGLEKIIGFSSGLTFIDDDIDLEQVYAYFVTAFNRVGDSPPSSRIEVWEKEPPVIGEDLTDHNVVPGGEITFSTRVRDNSRIKEVRVVYRIDGGAPVSIPMINGGEGIYGNTLVLDDRELDVDYRIIAVDVHGNRIETDHIVINVRGEYLPRFLKDLTPVEVEAFGLLTFSVKVDDDLGDPDVWLEFRTGEGPVKNTTMDFGSDGNYTYEVKVTGRPGEIVRYIFKAEDYHGNWNSTDVRTVRIVDGVLPMMEVDLSDGIACTGDTFSFRTMVRDDLGIGSVRVKYRFGPWAEEVLGLDRNEDGIWFGVVRIPHIPGEFNYRFLLEDSSRNTNETDMRTLRIVDNDKPSIRNYSVPAEVFNGREVRISCEASDNIALDKVLVKYRVGGDVITSLELSGDQVRTGSLKIPIDVTGDLEYHFEVFDTSGNTARSDILKVPIRDGERPSVSGVEDISTYAGLSVSAGVDVSDNIGIGYIVWSGFGYTHEGGSWEGSFAEEGTYEIEVTVSDLSNNTASTSFEIEVLSELHDGDGDGIPDLFELENGLSPDDPADADLDMDGDGLSNIEEYLLGTMLRSDDTDSDGMDDCWEVRFGLDPLVFSAYADTDADGLYDLEEYLSGTDPTVFDEETENDAKVLPLAALIAITIGILLFLVLAMMRRGRKE